MKGIAGGAFCLFIFAQSWFSFVAEAGEFSFRGGAGILLLNRADNISADGEKNIGSIHDKPGGVTRLYPFPDFEASCRNPEGVEYYLLSTYEDPGSLQAGVEKKFPDGSDLDSYVFYRFFVREWENPFVLQRQPMDVKVFGFVLSSENIASSGLALSYKLTASDPENDVAGEIYPDLRRDGISHEVTVSYRKFPFLVPAFTCERGVFKGKSNSYNKYGGLISLGYVSGDVTLNAKLSIARELFDRVHPIFGRRRDGEEYGISTALVWKGPFGLKRYSLAAGMSANRTDSNTNFYSVRETSAFTSLSYIF